MRSARHGLAGAPRPTSRWIAPLTIREIILAWGLISVLGVLVYLPHLLHGGFYSDDWADAAGALYPPGGSGFGNALAYFNDLLSSCRPVLILFFPLKYFVFGTHMKYLLALAVLLAILIAVLLYAVLRVLGVPWYHAWLLSALTIVYPWFDSTRFWESASPLSLALVFALAGLWIALVGLSRNSWRLHGCAAALYLLSMLTYEITLPLIASAGVLYVFRAGWKTARVRWGIDLIMVLVAGLWAWTHTPRTVSTLSGDIEHIREIATGGAEMLARTVLPIGTQARTGMTLGVLGIAVALGVIAYMLVPRVRTDSTGWGLREWLFLALGGLVVASLGWAMFIPADPYYTPTIFGVTNRVNGVAGFGLIFVAYAALGILGTLVAEVLRKSRGVAVAVTLVLGVTLGVAYVHVLDRHSDLWSEAFRAEAEVVNRVEAEFPDLPPGTTVFTSNHPANLTLGVPIFATTWDLNGMIKVRYEDGTLRAYPVTSELQLACQTDGVGIDGGGEVIGAAPYGTARLLDIRTGAHSSPRSRRECLAAVNRYPAGPLYVSTGY